VTLRAQAEKAAEAIKITVGTEHTEGGVQLETGIAYEHADVRCYVAAHVAQEAGFP
jgi:hypothetical protein